MRRRRLAYIAAGVVAGVGVALVLGAATSRYESVPQGWVRGPLAEDVPRWTRPCWRPGNRPGRAYMLACGRAEGRVVYVQSTDPDGDGDGHVVLLAGPRLVVVKVPAALAQDLPGLGDRITAVGVASDGPAGMPELRLQAPARKHAASPNVPGER